MNNWQTKKIGDVAKIYLGLTHTPKYVEEGIPFLSVKDISQGHINFNNTRFISREEFNSMPDGAKPKKDDVLFCRVGTIGYPQIINEDKEFGIFVSLGFFRAKKEILFNKYIAYWMRSPLFDDQVKKNVQGSTLKNLNTGWLKNFDILISSLDEQKRIVKVLDEVFEKIEKAKENTEKNLQNSRDLFESYLQILKGEKSALGALVDIKTGKLNANAMKENGQYPFFTCAKEIYHINTFAFDCEAILLAGNNASGDFNVKHYAGKFNAYQRTYVITVNKENKILYRFLYYELLKSLREFKRKSVGVGTKFLKLGMIQNMEIILPTIKDQEIIVKKLDELSEQTKRLEGIYKQKLANLGELKKSVLSKAFAGEI